MARARQASFDAIGTRWHIQISDELSDNAWNDLLASIRARIDVFDRAYSRFRSDSWVTRLSSAAGMYALPPDGFKLLTFYEQLYKLTGGKVTPLIGNVLADAGYDAAYSFQPKPLRSPPDWDAAFTFDERNITLHLPVLLDFGAAGKGYLVDIVGELCAAAGIGDYIINAGGDVLQRSTKQEVLAVGLENPADTSEAVGIAQLANASLCASAGSKRRWNGFHHIMDPQRLRPADRILASWVLAGDTMTADGIATALFFTGPAKLRSVFDFSYGVLAADMTLSHDRQFPVTVFEAQP